jgi:hypothetical protein
MTQVWVVTLHFNRGKSQILEYSDKAKAQECIRIAVFNNEDCINCSIFRMDKTVVASEQQVADRLIDLRKGIVSKF